MDQTVTVVPGFRNYCDEQISAICDVFLSHLLVHLITGHLQSQDNIGDAELHFDLFVCYFTS